MTEPTPSGATSLPPSRVLVVDDEPMVCEVVTRYLERDGHTVEAVGDGGAALRRIEEETPDLVVLDVMLPGVDGLEILRTLRREGDVPVILLTARADETDRVVGLELGADDYVVKPFSPRELAARVKTVLRRSGPPVDAAPATFGDLAIDPRSREVTAGGRAVELTRREFELLWFLASNPRRVFTREQLLRQVWESSGDWQDPATVTVHVRRVRRKLGEDASADGHIETVWGVGYRFRP